jgi:AraC-like DNA-binding protein
MYDHARLFARLLQVSSSDPAASLRVVSRRLGVHPHTLTQLVRAHTGASFSTWRAHRLVSGACRLLRTRPELSIKEVAAASGFSATSVFDRFLRRACGLSPSECRRSSQTAATGPEASCADRIAPLRRPARTAGAKVNVFVHPSTIDGDQPPPPDATLDVSRCTLSPGTSRSPT